jgi:putative DNA primase/helicase
VSGDLTVKPQNVTILQGALDAFDTASVVLPDEDTVKTVTRKAGVEMQVKGTGNALVVSAHDLTLDTEIETEDQGILTIRNCVENGIAQKIRCQTPFRSSTSFAAFMDTGQDGTPFLHDVGTGVTHWLIREDHEAWQLSAALGTANRVLDKSAEDCGAPFEEEAVKALAVIRKLDLAEYQRLRAEYKKRNRAISVVALDRAVKAKKTEALPPETHHGYASSLVEQLTMDNNPPVGSEGMLYVFDKNSGLWVAKTIEALIRMVAEAHDGLENCRRNSDYKNIAMLAISLADNPGTFADAPTGVACPEGFLCITNDEVHIEPLTAAHLQRVKINVTPTEQETPLFNKFLHDTFQSEVSGEEEQQVRLLQEVVGAIMFGIAHRYQKAVLFIDPFGRAGKGTLERIIRELVPDEFVSAVSPFNWANEYYLATLAGARLNVVGELPDDKSIPAAAFKTATGGDLLTGRHPIGRPFTFRNEAGHLFMSNHFISTRDQSEAFFARWILIEFPNSRLRSGLPLDPSLAERIIGEELAGIAHWALEGARRLLAQDGFSPSIVHDRLMAKWRRSTNSLLEFIHETCELEKDYSVRRSHFYQAYRDWCGESERRPFAKGKVKELLAFNVGLGVSLTSLNGYEIFRGIRIKEEEGAIHPHQGGGRCY